MNLATWDVKETGSESHRIIFYLITPSLFGYATDIFLKSTHIGARVVSNPLPVVPSLHKQRDWTNSPMPKKTTIGSRNTLTNMKKSSSRSAYKMARKWRVKRIELVEQRLEALEEKNTPTKSEVAAIVTHVLTNVLNEHDRQQEKERVLERLKALEVPNTFFGRLRLRFRK
jgi:hypothetical protein